MGEKLKVNIKFFDLDKGKEVDLSEEELIKSNSKLTINYMVENTTEVSGALLNLSDGIKRIVQTKIDFEDKNQEERTIFIMFQDKDKTIYK